MNAEGKFAIQMVATGSAAATAAAAPCVMTPNQDWARTHATPDAREPPAQNGLCFSALSVGGGALADPVGRCRDYRESGSPFPSPPAPSLARLSAKHHTRILVEKVS